MQAAAENAVPLEMKNDRGDTISQATLNLLEQRGKRRGEGNFGDDESLTKEIKRSKRQDKRAEILRALSEDLGDREQWMGIRQLRKQYQPIPYSSRDRLGRHIEMKDRAEEAAKFLAEEIWGLPRVERSTREERWPNDRYPKLVSEPLGINLGEITLTELRSAIRKLKRRKTAGPDEVPMELYKELDDDNLERVREVLNGWWNEEWIEDEALRARVVLIFKKGDSSDMNNYRPISLLNSLYKIFTVIIQRRLAEKMEPHLQRMQYGFRRNRGTADAIHCIRRIVDKGESTRTPTILMLLD